jgi:hypothetical protein
MCRPPPPPSAPRSDKLGYWTRWRNHVPAVLCPRYRDSRPPLQAQRFFEWPESISIKKNETALAIATVATILGPIVNFLIRMSVEVS